MHAAAADGALHGEAFKWAIFFLLSAHPHPQKVSPVFDLLSRNGTGPQESVSRLRFTDLCDDNLQ